MNKVIIVISGGVLRAVYSDNKNTKVELLDEDNGKADDNAYNYNTELYQKIENKKMEQVW